MAVAIEKLPLAPGVLPEEASSLTSVKRVLAEGVKVVWNRCGTKQEEERFPRRPKPLPLNIGKMDPAYTVRGHLHWVGVMWDWGWEGKKNQSTFVLSSRLDNADFYSQSFLVDVTTAPALLVRIAR